MKITVNIPDSVFANAFLPITQRLDIMTQIVTDLLAKVTQQTSISDGLRIAVTDLTGMVGTAVQVATSAVNGLQALKEALDAVIANGTLSNEDRQAITDAIARVDADTQNDTTKIAQVAQTAQQLAASSQALADAVAINTPSN